MGVTSFHCGLAGTAEEVQQQGEAWQQQAQADMHATLMRCFLQLLREQHAQRAQLLQRGLCQVLRLPFSASMPCCRYSPFAATAPPFAAGTPRLLQVQPLCRLAPHSYFPVVHFNQVHQAHPSDTFQGMLLRLMYIPMHMQALPVLHLTCAYT